MNYEVALCEECEGKGLIKVYNVYTPDVVEEEICGVCAGDGTVDEIPNRAPIRREQPSNEFN